MGNKIIVVHQIYHKRCNWTEDKSSLSLLYSSGIPWSTLPYQGAWQMFSRLLSKMQHAQFHRAWSNWVRRSCASRGSPRKQSWDKHIWHHAPLHCYSGRDGFCRDAFLFNKVSFKCHLHLLPGLWVSRTLRAPARWGENFPVDSFFPYI